MATGGEGRVSKIRDRLKSIIVRANEHEYANNQNVKIILGNLSLELEKLSELQEQKHASQASASFKGLTPGISNALSKLRGCIDRVDVQLDMIWTRLENGEGFKEGFAAFFGSSNSNLDGSTEVLRDCSQELCKVRTQAVKCGAFTVQPRSWEKNKPPNYVPVKPLRELLLKDLRKEKTIIQISGMFGMGKSALAVDLASELRRGFDYPGGVYFIVFGKEFGRKCHREKLDDKIYAELLHILEFVDKPKAEDCKPPAKNQEKIKKMLADVLPKHRCLFVLDDVWSLRRIGEHFFFDNHLGNLLITTRDGKCMSKGTQLVQIQSHHYIDEGLDERILTLNAALSTGIPSSLQGAARTILAKCHGCPFAVTIMGLALRNKTDSIEWQRVAQEFTSYAKYHGSLDGYAGSMFDGVAASVDLCGAHEELLEAVGLFKPATAIPKCLIKLTSTTCKSTTDVEIENGLESLTAHHILRSEEEFCQEQVGKHLICDSCMQTFYRLHPIVSEYAYQIFLERNSLHPLGSDSKTDISHDRMRLLCAFLLTYGHPKVAEESARVLCEFGDIGAYRNAHLDVMEGEVHEVKILARKLEENMSNDQLVTLKTDVIASTLSTWGLAKVIRTKEKDGLLDLEEAIKLHSENFITRRNLGLAHFILHDYKAAVGNLTAAKRLKQDDPLTLGFLGHAMLGMFDWEKARVELEALISKENNAINLSSLGLLKWKQGDLEGAQEDLEDCGNRNGFSLSILGAVKMERGDFAGAHADLEEALQLEDAAFTRCMQGLTKSFSRNYSAAKEDLDAALELRPDTPLFLSVRGDISRMMEDYDAASEDLEKAIELQPEPDSYTLSCLVNVRWMQGNYEDAIHHLASIS